MNKKSPAEQIDHLLKAAHSKSWILLGAIFILLAGLVFWTFVGRIPTEVLGKGIALSSEGVFSIDAKGGGIVSKATVKKGDVIAKGTHVVTIYNPMRRAYLTSVLRTKRKLTLLRLELKTQQERLESQEKLFTDGLIPKTTVEDTRLAISSKQISIEDANAALASAFSELEKISFQSREQFDLLSEQLIAATDENELDLIDEELSKVYSPKSGKVLEMLVSVGNTVNLKQPLVWIEGGGDETTRFLCCMPAKEKDRLQKGLLTQIEPSIVNAQEYGRLLGTVKEVLPYAISNEELNQTLHNQQVVNFLMNGEPNITQVIVEPSTDPKTISGFVWTFKKGPPYSIPAGTLCTVSIQVESKPPISYLLPFWKTGGEE